MIIEIKKQGIKFEAVPIGSLFAYPAHSQSNCDVYMAVEEHCIDGDKVNAVCLCDGYLHEFDDNEDVRLLNSAKLIIE
jgi:hypothetical protein